MIERSVFFERPRAMRCGTCRHEWHVTTEWLERFNQALEGCPICGTDCRGEGRPDFCAEPEGPMHDDGAVREFYWYHSSSHQHWPDKNFDPAAELTDLTVQRMKAMGLDLEGWAARQKSKALHVGTYEAAIENMFRRMEDQSGSLDQYYLYRVQLTPDCIIEPGVHLEPTDFVGNAHLAEVCTGGTTVLRYVNVHEDPSSVSLALEPVAIHAVQRIQIPLTVDADDPWVLTATARLVEAAANSSPQPTDAPLKRWRHQRFSALALEARRLESEIAAELPSGARERFNAGFDEAGWEAAPAAYPVKLAGLGQLVTEAQTVLEALDLQPWRKVS